MRIQISTQEEEQIDALAQSMSMPAVQAGRQILAEAAQQPIDPKKVLNSILGSISSMASGCEFTAGEIARKNFPNRQWAYTYKGGAGPKPDTTLAVVGRMLRSDNRQNSYCYQLARIEGGVSVYCKL